MIFYILLCANCFLFFFLVRLFSIQICMIIITSVDEAYVLRIWKSFGIHFILNCIIKVHTHILPEITCSNDYGSIIVIIYL